MKAKAKAKQNKETMAELTRITKDDIVAKLKDDGDFDRLRLNIIRKLKDDEELSENLRTIVRQSAAINRPGAENMKPRQLSDAIYQEIGDKLTGKISDGLWGIIRSSDGVKTDIVETVRSVYNRMNGQAPPELESVRANGSDHGFSEANEPIEPPGFSMPQKKKKKVSGDCCDDEDPDLPPGFG